MLESDWTKPGGTLSHKNACKEFNLTEDEVFAAMKSGKLQCRQQWAHGNPYFKLFRTEVEALALALRGAEGLKEQEMAHKLKTVNTEINSLKRKLITLEKQRMELIRAQEKG
ncbi:MAG: hypothetical protein IPH35_00565 [Rhodoferax sp.]|nr:hypothetical protein [Rhodoferax sp.]